MKNLSLYIHIPFCKRKCNYCDFPSFANEEFNHIEYVNALLSEIENKRSMAYGYIVNTVFFGGGTPTILSADCLQMIMDKIFEVFEINETAEITIEANPATFDYEKASKLREMGFNRMSIGVQAWQNELLEDLGRLHTIDEFVNNFNVARSVGFENINVDLMFALPNQTFEMWRETLENIVRLNPEHISLYSLIIEEGTVFYNQFEQGLISEIDEDLDRDMYHFAIEYLAENSYSQYEISNFAKDGFICNHNVVYWSMTDYLGLGLSSHSYYNGERFNNIYDLKDYIVADGDSRIIIENIEIVELNDEISEYMFLGLRMNKGISLHNFQAKYNKSIDEVYPNVVDSLMEQGLLCKNEECIFLSDRGIDLSNIVFEKFLI